MSQLDLNDIAGKYAVSVKPEEHPEDRKTRLAREVRDSEHKIKKESYALATALAVVVLAFLAGIGLLSFSPEKDSRTAGGALVTLIVGGFFGLLTGKGVFQSSGGKDA
jgi:hypothetical protein